MNLRQTQILCPQARVIPADQGRYQHAFDQFLEVLAGFTGGVEPDGPQPKAIGYLDLGCLKRAGPAEMAQYIGQTVREEVSLAPAVGLAGGKFSAYVAAASIEPNKALVVAPGGEAAFLAPFPVDFLPLDDETSRRLRLLGIHTLGQLAALPSSAIPWPSAQGGLTQFGTQGQSLHHLARGHDDRPVLSRRPNLLERASRQLDGPMADRAILEAIARAMAVELADRLEARGLMARELRLILHLEDGAAREERLVVRQPTSDSRRLTCILGELIAQARVYGGVTELEVILTDLIPAQGRQLDLFVPQVGQEHRLRDTLKDLVARYGADCFYRVSLFDRAVQLPERRFRLREVDGL